MSEFKKPSAYKSVNSSSFTAQKIQEYTPDYEEGGNVAWLVQNLKTLFVSKN